MKKTALYLMLLCFLGNKDFAAPQRSIKPLAEVSLIRLNSGHPMSFQPNSNQGFIVVALQNCMVMIDGQKEVFRSANFRQIKGKQILKLAGLSSVAAPLVLVTVKNADQNLTIEDTVLTPHQEVEDASDSNPTLVIAISPLQLRDVRDLNGEDESWRSSNPRTIKLLTGQTIWLPPGMHRIRNMENSIAHFVTIEW
jgi:hypothetical protein